ncbi:MAG: hypothetical protein QF464_08825 [Myxococcota bacterium]|nr:hypothetical protein [Myxococcota bacterium]
MTPTLELDLRDVAALRDAVTVHLPAGGLFVTVASPPPLFQAIDVALRLPDESFHMVQGQVVNQVPNGVFVVLSDPTARASLLAAATALLPEDTVEAEPAPEPEDEAPEDEAPEDEVRSGPLVGGSARPAWELLDSGSDVPLHKQIAALTVNDKLRLARQANRPVRRILIRDLEKRIHLEVVKNPQVKDDEAIEYAGTAGLSPVALEWFSSQSRYVKNKKMVMTLITNPMTPPRVARRLLDKLTHRELIKVMRSPRSREAIIRECRKRLMKAGVL